LEMKNDELANWLKSELGSTHTYHNHKEDMAWKVTAFYLPSIIGLSYIASSAKWELVGQVVITVGLTILTIAVLSFVSMQYKMRFIAADTVEGLRRAIAKLYDSLSPVSQNDLGVKSDDQWPQFVQHEIDLVSAKSKEMRGWKGFIKSFGYFLIFRWSNIENRIRTEIASYLSIAIISAVAISLIWIVAPSPTA
jgi:hypothetical protein